MIKEQKFWSRAIELSVEIDKATDRFPKSETYGITSQIRRAAVSVSSNIAEGAGRNSYNEYNYFLGIANGSLYKLQSQLIISGKLGLIEESALEPILAEMDELQMMNYKLMICLKAKAN